MALQGTQTQLSQSIHASLLIQLLVLENDPIYFSLLHFAENGLHLVQRQSSFPAEVFYPLSSLL